MKDRWTGKPTSKIHKKAWELFSVYIRKRDKGICFTCGAEEPIMHAGHYTHGSQGGKYRELYFYEKNVHAQCRQCNFWKHGNLAVYAIRLRQKYGPDILEELEDLKYHGKHLNRQDLKNLVGQRD